MAKEPDQIFYITSEEDGTSFHASFADGAPIVTEGYAGWQVVARPRMVGITEWQGRNPIAIEIPFMIDYWIGSVDLEHPGVTCEEQVSRLEKLCGIGTNRQPPICRVNSDGVIPHDYSFRPHMKWVIENVSWDRAIELRHGTTGRRLRCGGTLIIREFVTTRDILRKIKQTDRAVKPRIHIVKKHETLGKIANRFYHDPNRWKVIADANNMRDRRSLYVGQRLKIPRL